MKINDREQPVVFWCSTPVNPNETLLISGENFTKNSMVEFAVNDNWVAVKPLQITSQSLKAVVPKKWSPGIYNCKIVDGELVSEAFLLNAPDVWWCQGDEGVNRGRRNGWVRVFGKCLKNSTLTLDTTELHITLNDNYAVSAELPLDLPSGKQDLSVNGVLIGSFEVLPEMEAPEREINIVDYGADPTGKIDSTGAIVYALTEFQGRDTKGVLHFPCGRYRVDSKIRVDGLVEAPLNIPANVVFRGDGPDLTTLWWPDHDTPLPSLIEGGNDFGIEDLAIYTQGRHGTLIKGDSNVRVNNVRIRANCHYMTAPGQNGKAHFKRGIEANPYSGSAFLMTGVNNHITNCDIYTSGLCFHLIGAGGSLVANNKIMGSNMLSLMNGHKVIFENNEFTGNHLSSGGNNIYMTYSAENVYYARNTVSHIYGGDHEAFSLDGHATAYLGAINKLDSKRWKLEKKKFPKDAKGSVYELAGLTAYIIDGRGRGQYRRLADVTKTEFTLDSPWKVEPDDSSLVCVGGFNGRHLFIGNTSRDTGPALQLYPPNFECVVAENRSIRTANFNSLSHLSYKEGVDFVRVEPSWYNQFLDNHVLVGNGWGGGTSDINFWLGGESCLLISALQTYYTESDEQVDSTFMCSEGLRKILGEDSNRKHSISLTLFQIVRKHKIDNNSSIRIRGAVEDVVIENCEINNSRNGIRVDMEMDFERPNELGQLFDFDPEPGSKHRPIPFLSPQSVLIRDNCFNDVAIPHSGSAEFEVD